jgi:signal transduction histidine kinase
MSVRTVEAAVDAQRAGHGHWFGRHIMRAGSLRLRLAAGAAAAIVLALIVAGFGLTFLFERVADRAMMGDLEVSLRQLGAGIEIDDSGRLTVSRPPVDPRFADPLSGLYWQVKDDRDGLVRSRSLWDTVIALPDDPMAPGEMHHHLTVGPANQNILVVDRAVLVPDGKGERLVRATVAADRERIESAQSAFALDLIQLLALLAIVLGAAAWFQIGLGLKPLDAIRRGISDIRSGAREYLPADVPAEVRPLVDEVNALLDMQRREMMRARDRAADLAHGLKTPLAALAAEVRRLREKGDVERATDLRDIAETMCRHVDRELVRARVRQHAWPMTQSRTELKPLVGSLIGTLARTPQGARIEFQEAVAGHVTVPCDRIDLTEVLGNLLENAVNHARKVVRISAPDAPMPRIEVEDDGPGVPPESRSIILQRGRRLDECGSAGLGLAIVQDVLEAYGWTIKFGTSELGGLKATIFPASG